MVRYRGVTDEEGPIALVVDDDVFVRMSACDILEEAGFTTLDAADGAEALVILEERDVEIGLLFTDVEFGSGIDGFEVACIAATRWPDIGVLVASGAAVPKAGELPSSVTFIRKPFSKQVVHDRLQELLPDNKKPEPLRQKSADR